MDTTWWKWIFLLGVLVIVLLYGMIARMIARRRSGLDEKEMAVVRRAARVGGGEQIGRTLGLGVLVALQVPAFLMQNIRYLKHRAAAKKSSTLTRENRTARRASSFRSTSFASLGPS